MTELVDTTAGAPASGERGRGTEPKATVLIVDDDPGVGSAIQRILEQRDLVVELARDGATALQEVDARAYDVIILDLRMSNLDGFEVLRALRSRPNPPPTILHSAYLDVPTTVEAMKYGVADVIEKPVSSKALGDRVWDLVHKRREASRALANDGETDPAARLLGETPVMRELREQIRRIAQFRDVSVLIEGHTGTGKELVALAIHEATSGDAPLVSVNCAAVPESLFESELFGHEAGAFTNAKSARAGLLEEAANGTLFLDEIGEMPASLQPKLLRVLETREFRRLGSNRSRRLTARVISATNRPLSGGPEDPLRSDLYFRLAGYTIVTPRLADRLDDVPMLAQSFAHKFSARYGLTPARLSEAALATLRRHDWPGNVRELRVVVENASVLAAPHPIDAGVIAQVLSTRAGESAARDSGQSGSFPALKVVASEGVPVSLREMERDVILGAFSKYSPNLSKTAKYLGIPRSTLRDRLRKLGAL